MNEGFRGQTWGWDRAKDGLGVRKRLPQAGRGRLTRGDAPPRLRKLSVPGRLKLRPPWMFQS